MKKSIYGLFIFVLLFCPLAFGTVEPWSLAVMESASVAGLFLFFYRRARSAAPFVYEIPGILPLMILLGYILFQAVPLPPYVVRILSPVTYSLYGTAAWAEGSVRWVPLSLNGKATVTEFFRIASYAAFYVLTVQLLARRELLKRTIVVIAVFSSLLSLFGIIQHLLQTDKIFWIRSLSRGGLLFGPYVNRDHFAGLMEMLFPSVLCLFLFYKPEVAYGPLRDRVLGMFDNRMTNTHILLGFSSVLIATSIFLTLSRAAIVSLCLSMIAVGGVLLLKERKKARGKFIIMIFVLALLFVGWFGWSPVVEKFSMVGNEVNTASLRPGVWSDTMKIVRDFPLLGSGFGSFVHIYPKYRSIPFEGVVDHVHNDYIELLAEGGIIGTALFCWFLTSVFYSSLKAFSRRRESYSIYMFSGAMAGVFSILVHSLVDFNLHIGANGLYFFFLLGLVVSTANTRMRDGLGETSLSKRKLSAPKVTASASFILLVSVFFCNAAIVLGGGVFSSVGDISSNPHPAIEDLRRTKELAMRAAFFDPLEARYYYAAGTAEWRLGERSEARASYTRAILLDPVNAEYVQMLGLLIAGPKESAAAGRLIRSGVDLDASNPWVYRQYASWLFASGRKEQGEAAARKAIEMKPAATKEYITLMVLNRLDNRDIGNALPERAEVRRIFADYLAQTGDERMADEEYKKALYLIGKEKRAEPQFFYNIRQYYDRSGRYDEALAVMNKATETLPEDAGLHIASGEAYEQAGISYRAAEEYRKALLIDPNNRAARNKLDALRH
jgi:O-antigen ligase/Flp pilus assembly protein TadD